MLTLIKNLNERVLITEAPSLLLSLLMTEFLFKFHSFTLECLTFLALWTVLSAIIQRLTK